MTRILALPHISLPDSLNGLIGIGSQIFRADHDHTVDRNWIPLQFVSGDGFATEDNGGWIETQRFLKDLARVHLSMTGSRG